MMMEQWMQSSTQWTWWARARVVNLFESRSRAGVGLQGILWVYRYWCFSLNTVVIGSGLRLDDSSWKGHIMLIVQLIWLLGKVIC